MTAVRGAAEKAVSRMIQVWKFDGLEGVATNISLGEAEITSARKMEQRDCYGQDGFLISNFSVNDEQRMLGRDAIAGCVSEPVK